MTYASLRECVDELARTGRAATIDEPVDAVLEAAEIQRRVFASGGPAVVYARVRGCRFPMVSNVFGTRERVRFLADGTTRLLADAAASGAKAFHGYVQVPPSLLSHVQVQLPRTRRE